MNNAKRLALDTSTPLLSLTPQSRSAIHNPRKMSFAARGTRGGNDEEWKAWKAIEPGFPPLTLLLQIPSGFPTLRRRGRYFKAVAKAADRMELQHRKGGVTDVSDPKGNAFPGTLTSSAQSQDQREKRSPNPRHIRHGSKNSESFEPSSYSISRGGDKSRLHSLTPAHSASQHPHQL
jgi:hypothetical protein